MEHALLTTSAGQALLGEVAQVRRPGPADLARWRRGATAQETAAALRLVEARRKGAAKFERAERMWLDPVGIEQATAEAVARAKARRFAGRLVVDLCCGIGGDTCALAAEAPLVLAVDADAGMTRRARWNAEVHEVGRRVALVRADARRFPIPGDARVHIDPDRRAGTGPRARSLRDYAPGLTFLHEIMTSAVGGAIKVGPASDFAEHFRDVEVELVSLNGECKEATVWFGDRRTCARRATCLPEGVTWTDNDGALAEEAVPVVGPLTWVYDPDPALARSGLLDGFARAHGLGRVAAGVDYLTGLDLVEGPFLAAFAVVETWPLDLKKLARYIRERRLGPLEIKARGVDLRVESLRARLRPPGPNPATLLLVGGRGPALVLLAERHRGPLTRMSKWNAGPGEAPCTDGSMERSAPAKDVARAT